MKSVSATELAKLGKCEKLVIPQTGFFRRKVKIEEKTNTADKERGDRAHARYEAAVERHMTSSRVQFRKTVKTSFKALVVLATVCSLYLITRT